MIASWRSGPAFLRMARALSGSCPWPAASQAAQGEAGELSGADGVGRAACGPLPHPPVPADKHVQHAVDVGDLDEQGAVELIEQLRDVDHGLAVPPPPRACSERARTISRRSCSR